MIYVDTSVALAQLLAEDRCPSSAFWSQDLVTSRLLEYEVWTAIHRRGLEGTHAEDAHRLLQELAFAELSREVLRRATERFPVTVRTLDALHLATLLFLRDQGIDLHLAAYDRRMIDAAEALRIPLVDC